MFAFWSGVLKRCVENGNLSHEQGETNFEEIQQKFFLLANVCIVACRFCCSANQLPKRS